MDKCTDVLKSAQPAQDDSCVKPFNAEDEWNDLVDWADKLPSDDDSDGVMMKVCKK